MDGIFESVLKENAGFRVTSNTVSEITKMIGQLITEIDGNADEMIKIFKKHRRAKRKHEKILSLLWQSSF